MITNIVFISLDILGFIVLNTTVLNISPLVQCSELPTTVDHGPVASEAGQNFMVCLQMDYSQSDRQQNWRSPIVGSPWTDMVGSQPNSGLVGITSPLLSRRGICHSNHSELSPMRCLASIKP